MDKEKGGVCRLLQTLFHYFSIEGLSHSWFAFLNKFPLTSVREVKILKALKHPGVINLLEVAVGKRPESIFLVFEYCEHEIAELIDRNKKPFTEAEVKTMMLQMLSAMACMHRNFILHRDIKLSNVLMNNKGEVKIADFGLARFFSTCLWFA